MSAPTILCVDDSEAILALERAVLGADYTVATASDGVEALERVRELRPSCVLLDVSMPRLDGDEVLARIRGDPELAEVPVILVTSETERARACADAWGVRVLPKPLRAPDLLEAVAKALADREATRRSRALAILVATIGGVEFAIPLARVRLVAAQPSTRPLAGGPPHLARLVTVHGEGVAVLDVARVLSIEHAQPMVERKLVVLSIGTTSLALCVDGVSDPVEVDEEFVRPRDQLGGWKHGDLSAVLVALVTLDGRPIPVLEPAAFLEPELLRGIAELVRKAGDARG